MKEESAEDGKTKVFCVRLPLALAERFQRLKHQHAHSRVPSSELLLEAVKLYIDHAECFGLDENLVVKEPPLDYNVKHIKGGHRQK